MMLDLEPSKDSLLIEKGKHIFCATCQCTMQS